MWVLRQKGFCLIVIFYNLLYGHYVIASNVFIPIIFPKDIMSSYAYPLVQNQVLIRSSGTESGFNQTSSAAPFKSVFNIRHNVSVTDN